MTKYDPDVLPDHFGLPYQLAFVYVTFAGMTDFDLDVREADAIVERLTHPDWGFTDMGTGFLAEATEYWEECLETTAIRHFTEICQSLALHLGSEDLQRIYDDLEHVARADGDILPEELDLLANMKDMFGL